MQVQGASSCARWAALVKCCSPVVDCAATGQAAHVLLVKHVPRPTRHMLAKELLVKLLVKQVFALSFVTGNLLVSEELLAE